VRLFVVLNKADYLHPDDLERTVAFTGRVVRQAVPGWPKPVYPLSARPDAGDPGGLRRFQQDLGGWCLLENPTLSDIPHAV
jgi:hypothetical protein